MYKRQDHERRETLKKYAYEYYLLGNECITKAHDTRAALANFDKALALDPLLSLIHIYKCHYPAPLPFFGT